MIDINYNGDNYLIVTEKGSITIDEKDIRALYDKIWTILMDNYLKDN